MRTRTLLIIASHHHDGGLSSFWARYLQHVPRCEPSPCSLPHTPSEGGNYAPRYWSRICEELQLKLTNPEDVVLAWSEVTPEISQGQFEERAIEGLEYCGGSKDGYVISDFGVTKNTDGVALGEGQILERVEG